MFFIASRIFNVPIVPTLIVNSGILKDTATCDWAAKLNIFSGSKVDIRLFKDDESNKSE